MQSKLATGEYDPVKAKHSLQMLLINRGNEFRELASAIGYPIHLNEDWEEFMLRFCLEFDDCFRMWSSKYDLTDHNKVHKCMTMMRQIAMKKSNITEVSKLQNTVYRIVEDFKIIYARLS